MCDGGAGTVLWPSPADGIVTITPAQMGYLLSGIDWRNPRRDVAADLDRMMGFALGICFGGAAFCDSILK